MYGKQVRGSERSTLCWARRQRCCGVARRKSANHVAEVLAFVNTL